MGTHPIFESDFDCLTDHKFTKCFANKEKLLILWATILLTEGFPANMTLFIKDFQ